ncbi:hypothetical protein [Nocardioides sp.]|uniref:hypothetical protein n=1 Tax=Nocardioides sp. TaxID=35761 RepID=UPI0031FF1D81|nr:hypothetical protein [Nocardioides sp.]
MSSTEALEVPRRPIAGTVIAVLVAIGAAGAGAWFVNHPEDLPTSDERVTASTPVGQPVYVGVFSATADLGRTLHLSGVKVHTTSNAQVEVVPLLCHGGTIGVTADPAAFCADLVNPEGETFGPGDDIVLEVTSETAGVAVIDRVRLGYRDGLQVDTQEAGAPVVVNILDRAAGTPVP